MNYLNIEDLYDKLGSIQNKQEEFRKYIEDYLNSILENGDELVFNEPVPILDYGVAKIHAIARIEDKLSFYCHDRDGNGVTLPRYCEPGWYMYGIYRAAAYGLSIGSREHNVINILK